MMRLEYVHKYIYHSRYTSEHNGEVQFDHFKRNRILTLISYKACISTPIMKLEMMICATTNCYIDETIPEPIHWPKSVCGVGIIAHNKATHLNWNLT
jgi:hypothetical protein